MFFKFEPFIVHVMCRTIETAQSMVVPPPTCAGCVMPRWSLASGGCEFGVQEFWYYHWKEGPNYAGKVVVSSQTDML